MEINLLAVGDVVGSSGVKMLARHLRSIKKRYDIAFTVVNGENAASTGIYPNQAEDIFAAGADVITLGNHAFGKREINNYLSDNRYILRPANYAPQRDGSGVGVYDCGRYRIAVIDLLGRLNMSIGPNNPFLMIDDILKNTDAEIKIVELHAEATSEKQAMGWMLDGRVAAVYGTHTHVPTADERILPKGTGYISDLGMTGPYDSVIGIRPEQSIALFRGDQTSRFEQAPGACRLDACVFTIDTDSGLCRHIERVNLLD
ncbi:MAG: TIGR00282 family metallophosphoesterase [Ruminococcaceae bacterium]|nr:TIGR00282 family metallophosphoesterase [Oscillospiraceae bacterium]